jgi:hypothetical protein
MFSYVLVTDGQMLAKLDFGVERNRLAIEPAENHIVGFVAIIYPEPHPLGFARRFIPNLELDVVTRLVFHNRLSSPPALSGISGFASHYFSEIDLRYRFYEIREVAMKVRVLLELDLSLLPIFVN